MESTSAVLALILITTLSLKYGKSLLKMFKQHRAVSKLPSLVQRAYPLIGHLYLFPADSGLFAHRWRQLFAPLMAAGRKVTVVWFGPRPVCCLIHPDAAEVVLRSTTLIDKPDMYQKAVPWLGDGLPLSSGQKWFQRRRLITPSFHFNILEHFLAVMNDHADVLARKVERMTRGGVDHVHLNRLIQLCTLDIICETAMGVRIGAQDNEDHYYVKATEKAAVLNLKRVFNPVMHFDFVYRRSKLAAETKQVVTVLHDFTARVIAKKLESAAKGDADEVPATATGKRRMAFLDVLINARTEDGGKLSATDIQEEVDTFMFAGHDTNSAAMHWTLYLLARHADVQRKVHDEVDRVFAGARLSTADLRQLTYLETVIKESLRLYSPAPAVARVFPEGSTILGHFVPPGVQCSVGIATIHRNPDVWRDPDRFDPDRFGRERSAGRHPYAFIPFSAGPRNCIGQRFAMQEQKVLLSHFLRRFAVTCHVDESEVRALSGLVARPADDVIIHLTSREVARDSDCDEQERD